MNSSTALQRKDAPKESKWNAEGVFASWDDWRTELELAIAGLPELRAFCGRLGEGAELLADWLETYSRHSRRMMRLLLFADMAKMVDTADAEAKSMHGRVLGFAGQFSAATAFAEPEMLTLEESLLDWTQQEPRLEIYAHYFDDLLRQKEHTRSAEVEEVLGMLEDPFSNTRQTYVELTSADLTFADAVDSQGNRHIVQQAMVPPTGIDSSDREQRRTAWENYCDSHIQMQNTLASNYMTNVKQTVFLARVRGYKTVLESMLAPQNLQVEIFHNLITVFQDHLPVWHRYWDVKRKALGVETLYPYDIWAPLVPNPPKVDFAQAIEWIGEALSPLGEEYVSVLRQGCLQERWVDYAPNAGKVGGARSMPSFDMPPFIFMSYAGNPMSMSILAHELGHSMHAYLTDRYQPDVYNGFGSMAVAETASNLNQALTRAYLMQAMAEDAQFQLALIEEAMFNFHRYFFIMPTLARFELEVYTRVEAGQTLTADDLNSILANLYAEGYGTTLVDEPARTGITWTHYIHMYMPYYAFQYSIGISAAHALAADISDGNELAVRNYLSLLKAGRSLYSMDLFRLAGVDMSTPEPVEKTFSVLAGIVDRLESLVAPV